MTAFQKNVQFINAARGAVESFTLPANDGLMLEFLTANFTLDSSAVVPVVFISTQLDSGSVKHLIPLTRLDPNNWGTALTVKLYGKNGSTVGVQVSSINGGVFNGSVTIAGRLTNIA